MCKEKIRNYECEIEGLNKKMSQIKHQYDKYDDNFIKTASESKYSGNYGLKIGVNEHLRLLYNHLMLFKNKSVEGSDESDVTSIMTS